MGARPRAGHPRRRCRGGRPRRAGRRAERCLVPGTDGAPHAKVGAIGLHVAEGVTSHGIAINCDNALDAYAAIVPCGIADAGVTTLSHAAGRNVTVDEVADVVADRVRAAEHGMRTGRRISNAAARQETLV
ncbi:hypothetical protein GCM10017714_05010 [Curtobacterium pusillum]|uniref:lipoyl protein ligase domain-containing protein n=1 Tax=Curtobacterium pusillum TaxID=69373 RepID=UPI002329D225|nr:hypothetical protein GCM10017610_00490 [Curtobacterium pusillum]